MDTLDETGYRVYLEIGPSTTLLGLGRQCVSREDVLWLPSLKKDRSDWFQILDSVSHLYVSGAEMDWAGFDKPYARRRVPLPTYPFDRQRYWIEEKVRSSSGRATGNPRLGIGLSNAVPTFETTIGLETWPELRDHVVLGCMLLPGAAYMELIYAAAKQEFGADALS